MSFFAGALTLLIVEAAGITMLSKKWIDLDYID